MFPGMHGTYPQPRVHVGRRVLRIELEGDDDGCVLHFVVLFDDAERASRDAAGWHVCLDRLEQHLGGAATQSPSSEATPD
jgi:hypothetical protein